jgi:hypothetical protein
MQRHDTPGDASWEKHRKALETLEKEQRELIKKNIEKH